MVNEPRNVPRSWPVSNPSHDTWELQNGTSWVYNTMEPYSHMNFDQCPSL
ncbi:unnamed protein product, partial [Arabidopsis halleri]